MKKYSVLFIVWLIVCGTIWGSEDLSNQQKEIMQFEPQRDFNYTKVYQHRWDYQTKTIVEHNWDPSLTSCRFFFDKNRALGNNSYYLDLSDILDWDIQYILDPKTVPETIRVLSYERNPKSFKRVGVI